MDNFWDKYDKENNTSKKIRQGRVRMFEYFLNNPDVDITKLNKERVVLKHEN